MQTLSLQEHAVRLTEKAAIACYDFIGTGHNNEADNAAVEAMRKEFNHTPISGRVVIGEGERDEAPMLFIGEEVGTGGDKIDIAVDPLEGTTVCANGLPNSISVLAFAKRGNLLHAPDVYMEKIATASKYSNGISLKNSAVDNIIQLAKNMGKSVPEITVCILDRSRHEELIKNVRSTGAKVHLIGDCDVTATIATTLTDNPVDIYLGSGGSPEGVLSAAALQCYGGFFEGQLIYRNDDEKSRAKKVGINDFDKIYSMDDLASGDIIFAATGVTSGWFLNGVKKSADSVTTSSICITKTGDKRAKRESTYTRFLNK